MIANILAFIATVVTLVFIEVVYESQTGNFFRFTVAILFFGAANTVNQSLRHRVKGEPASDPLLDDDDEPAEVAANQTITIPWEEAKRSSASISNSGSTEQNELPIGRVVDDRLMLKPSEIEQILLEWDQFSNVFQLVSPAPVMVPGGEVRWYLVLSPNSAVFFNENGDQIWTVRPEGIKVKRHSYSNAIIGFEVASVDGRREKIQPGMNMNALASILAWTSESLEAFQKKAFLQNSIWMLLAREVETGHSSRSFLRWKLPYKNMEEGIRQVEQDEKALKAFVRLVQPKVVMGKLDSFEQDDPRRPIRLALDIEASRRGRNLSVGLACFMVVMAFVGVWIPYCSRALEGRTAWAIFLSVAAISVAAIVRSQLRFRNKVNELEVIGARGLSANSPAHV